ncbi:hypothetical protein M5K25_015822 [Dendrobium thyrsiflorum]|uniref:NADH dehydrogenase subunit 6 n=1 Tax=Dendrobium thyrsiflorum TaxID=117978 RepID=A0ABD0US83_DENTH
MWLFLYFWVAICLMLGCCLLASPVLCFPGCVLWAAACWPLPCSVSLAVSAGLLPVGLSRALFPWLCPLGCCLLASPVLYFLCVGVGFISALISFSKHSFWLLFFL